MAQASRGDEGLGQRQAERRLLKSQEWGTAGYERKQASCLGNPPVLLVSKA